MTPWSFCYPFNYSFCQAGITNTEVLSAMERTSRDYFIPPHFQVHAYESGCADYLGRLFPSPYRRVYDPGWNWKNPYGFGDWNRIRYQAAVLSHLARRVYTIERHKPLPELAEQRFQELKLRNITTLAGDGTKGVGEQSLTDDRDGSEGEPCVLGRSLKLAGWWLFPLARRAAARKAV